MCMEKFYQSIPEDGDFHVDIDIKKNRVFSNLFGYNKRYYILIHEYEPLVNVFFSLNSAK